ncbi:S-layer homology domain-containing protein [Romboutsia lituseburensis]|uniref:S-layer homology domain-containing protein n=1 Tax=Romboutsia lituseburensis TaxID=1537 RepID=UPI00215A7264|nr:S-layer homology domain-containing protein [Romboutsia lituseburensis]MCR8746783.1 S-layer homology domain-containing protein [Romboutsia lituseburensis]
MRNNIIKVLIFTFISFIFFDYNSYDINANEKLSTSTNIQNEEVNIPDKILKEVVLRTLGKNPMDSITITISDMESLTSLSFWAAFSSDKISNLEGIQYAKNLKYLDVSYNKISDIGPLTNLTNLKDLDVSYNKISDIGPLRNLTKLERLNLDSNHILDFSPLKNLPNKEKFRYGTILEQNVYYDEVRLTGDSFKIKNPFIGIDGEMLTELYGQRYGNYMGRSEGDYLIWDNITEKDIRESNFQLIAAYYWDYYYDGMHDYNRVSELHIPIAPFNDIYNHWAEDTIREYERKKIIAKDVRFRPNEAMTRAEFVKIFNKTFKLSKHSGKTFKDTKNHWAYYEIDIAVTNGVCNGKTETEFKPDDPITRQEAATMLSNYLNLSDNNIDKIVKYKDSNDISSWAKPSVEGVIEKGYMGGYSDNTFRPKNKITRAEALSMLSRIK